MQKIRIALMLVLVLTALAVPVPAGAADINSTAGSGVFLGRFAVGKTLVGTCANDDQSGKPSGGGLGIPVLTGNKSGWWKWELPAPGGFFHMVPHSLSKGQPALVACGRLSPMASVKKTAVGAACSSYSGHEGFGTLTAGPFRKKLRNIAWSVSPLGLILLTGRMAADDKAKKAQGHVVAYMYNPAGGPQCLDKSTSGSGKTGGATSFLSAGVIKFVN